MQLTFQNKMKLDLSYKWNKSLHFTGRNQNYLSQQTDNIKCRQN